MRSKPYESIADRPVEFLPYHACSVRETYSQCPQSGVFSALRMSPQVFEKTALVQELSVGFLVQDHPFRHEKTCVDEQVQHLPPTYSVLRPAVCLPQPMYVAAPEEIQRRLCMISSFKTSVGSAPRKRGGDLS